MTHPAFWDDLSMAEKLMYQQLVRAGYKVRIRVHGGRTRVDVKRGWFTVASRSDDDLAGAFHDAYVVVVSRDNYRSPQP